MTTCKVPWCEEAASRPHPFCSTHWRMLPIALRARLNEHYRRGQEYHMIEPTQEYRETARACVEWLKVKSGGSYAAR